MEKTASNMAGPSYADDAQKVSESLTKLAGLPYKEEVYSSVKEVLKIASDCIDRLSSSLKSEEDNRKELEKAASVRILVDDMVQSGATDEDDLQEKVAELMGKTPRQLEIYGEAVKLAQSGNSGNKFFELTKEASLGTSEGIFGSVLG